MSKSLTAVKPAQTPHEPYIVVFPDFIDDPKGDLQKRPLRDFMPESDIIHTRNFWIHPAISLEGYALTYTYQITDKITGKHLCHDCQPVLIHLASLLDKLPWADIVGYQLAGMENHPQVLEVVDLLVNRDKLFRERKVHGNARV